MTGRSRSLSRILTGAAVLLVALSTTVSAQDYPALDGVTSVDAVFDLKTGTPQRTALYLDLMHQLLTDESFAALAARPNMVVVVAGAAITHISSNREGFSPEDAEALDQIAATVSALAADGIAVEACLFAAGRLGVDPASLLPEVRPVGNGWISLMGWQAQGYSLVTVY